MNRQLAKWGQKSDQVQKWRIQPPQLLKFNRFFCLTYVSVQRNSELSECCTSLLEVKLFERWKKIRLASSLAKSIEVLTPLSEQCLPSSGAGEKLLYIVNERCSHQRLVHFPDLELRSNEDLPTVQEAQVRCLTNQACTNLWVQWEVPTSAEGSA